LRRYLVVAICALVVGCRKTPEVPPRQADALRRYTTCEFADGLKAVSVDRLPENVTRRPVETTSGPREITLADGYRVLLAYPDGDYFVNLKVEMSEAGKFTEDKKAVIDQMGYLSAQAKGAPLPLEHATMKGLDAYSLNNPGIAGTGPISFYSLFDDAKGVVITAYLLNQRPDRRKFKTIEEYRVLRDAFLDSFTACVGEVH